MLLLVILAHIGIFSFHKLWEALTHAWWGFGRLGLAVLFTGVTLILLYVFNSCFFLINKTGRFTVIQSNRLEILRFWFVIFQRLSIYPRLMTRTFLTCFCLDKRYNMFDLLEL